jgi:hypothetical protein
MTGENPDSRQAKTSAEPPPDPPSREDGIEALLLGPTALGAVVGVQIVISLWRTFSERWMSAEELARYTSAVLPLSHPDFDRPIYLSGTVLIVLVAVAANLVWRRALRTAQSPEQRRKADTILFLHFPVALAALLLPALCPSVAALNRVSAVAGATFLVAARAATRLANQGPLFRISLSPRGWRWIEVCLVAIFVVLCLFLPDTATLSSFVYRLDRYHHWNYFAMGPALAYRHGVALATDFYSQYGVAWPMLLAWLSHLAPLTYRMALFVAALWGCVYYTALFVLLRLLVKNTWWALAGLLLTLALQCFGGLTGARDWALPSSTVMRYSMDVFFFSICLLHARGGRTWLGALVGTVTGLALLLSSDTGFYLTVCLAVYLLAVRRLRPSAASPVPSSPEVPPPETRRFAPGKVSWLAAWATLAFVVTALAGLAIASRGTIVRREFWTRWLEPLVAYGGGITDLPIAPSLSKGYVYLLLASMLACYVVAILRATIDLWSGATAPGRFVVGLLALYGMATLLLYVGRSDPAYLFNVAVPFCVVLTSFLADAHRWIVQKHAADCPTGRPQAVASLLACVPPTAVGLAALALFGTASFQDYPGLLQSVLGNRWSAPQAASRGYLFADSRDAPMPYTEEAELRRFRAITQRLRELAQSGRNTVAVMDMMDTAYLVDADLKPFFRFSPVLSNLATRQQVKEIQDVLVNHPPDYVLFPAESPRALHGLPIDDVHTAIKEVLHERFEQERRIEDMEVYRRKP